MKSPGFIFHRTPGISPRLPSSPRISPSIKKNPQVHIIMKYINNKRLLEFLKINQVGTTSPLNKVKLILLNNGSAKSIALDSLWYIYLILYLFKFKQSISIVFSWSLERLLGDDLGAISWLSEQFGSKGANGRFLWSKW